MKHSSAARDVDAKRRDERRPTRPANQLPVAIAGRRHWEAIAIAVRRAHTLRVLGDSNPETAARPPRLQQGDESRSFSGYVGRVS
jgi:hypothetical protein